MKRIVFCTVGSLGDLHPYIAIAKALMARGHHPVITTIDRHQSVIEAQGIDYAPLRPGEASFGGIEAIAAKLFDPLRGPGILIREMVMPYLREQYEDIAKAAEGADLLVTHPLTMSAPLVGQVTGLPWVSTVLAPASLMSAIDRPLLSSAPWARALRMSGETGHRVLMALAEWVARRWERPLEAFRIELGLPRSPHAALFRGQFSTRLTLALFPLVIAAPQRDWPAHTIVTGMPRFDGQAMTPAEAATLSAFLTDGEPPIVFALGSSVVMIAGDFWDKAIEAASRLGRRALLLTGTPLAQPLPPGIKAFDYLPYSRVFPAACAVVHQAGIGTLTQALAAGRPQLAVPVAFDQPDNARRAVALGVGRAVPMQKVTAANLARELALLFSEPSYARRAKDVAPEIVDGSARAADALLGAIA